MGLLPRKEITRAWEFLSYSGDSEGGGGGG